MENDWYKKYGVGPEEIEAMVRSACGNRRNWRLYGDEILGHVGEVLSRKAPEGPTMFPNRHALMGYIFEVAKNRLIRLSQQAKRQAVTDPIDLAMGVEGGPSESEQFRQLNEQREAIIAALDGAYHVTREVVRLTMANHEPGDIAGILGISPQSVYRRLAEAKEFLRRKLSERA
jgi:RNA polymerase sigma factor (sigma-70 family)